VDLSIINFVDNNDFADFYTVDESFMFKREDIANPFWKIFMESELDKVNKRSLKSELFEYGVKSSQTDYRSLVVISWVLFLV
jgi:hypothetical protein